MVVLESVADLAWAANLAALELHVPQWQVDDDGAPQLPDLLVLDLDPGPDTAVAECCAVAERLGARLEADGLDPVREDLGLQGHAGVRADRGGRPRAPQPVRQGAGPGARRRDPDDVVWRMEKVLRPGKVLIDWSQNNPAKTTVAPYSLRARAGATVVDADRLGRGARVPPDPATCGSPPTTCSRGSRSTATCSPRCSPTSGASRSPCSASRAGRSAAVNVRSSGRPARADLRPTPIGRGDRGPGPAAQRVAARSSSCAGCSGSSRRTPCPARGAFAITAMTTPRGLARPAPRPAPWRTGRRPLAACSPVTGSVELHALAAAGARVPGRARRRPAARRAARRRAQHSTSRGALGPGRGRAPAGRAAAARRRRPEPATAARAAPARRGSPPRPGRRAVSSTGDVERLRGRAELPGLGT